MECEIIINPYCDEKVVIYAKEESNRLNELKSRIERSSAEILGYNGSEIKKLDILEIQYITITSGKVFAVCAKEKYLLRERLYSLEEKLPSYFVRINQSCLANIKKTERFDTSISGTLKIRFKNGDTDYVSRRQLKAVKERIGI